MSRSTEEFRSVFKAARRAGTPLVAVRTADPASTMAQVMASLNGKSEIPVVIWDIHNGLVGRNEQGKAAVGKLVGENAGPLGPADALAVMQKITRDAVLFFLNPQRVWEQIDVLQGIWNLRDVFKANGQMLVLISTPGASLPPELQSDVMVIDEPLPSAENSRHSCGRPFEAAELRAPIEETV
jgi:hypothetical protein